MDPIYLDHAATTPVRAEVRSAMEPYLADMFGNPSSAHRFGRKAAAGLATARERIASALGARPTEIYFVRGGTESDNLAVRGRAQAVAATGERPVVAATAIEHSAVLESLDAVVAAGGEKHVIPVDRTAQVDDQALGDALSIGPAVFSAMWVNNEVGTILPISKLADRCYDAGVAMHSDAVQAIGKVRIRLDEVPLSLMTATGHKIYGPRTTGLLFVRQGIDLVPGLFGGGQERGLRPGTEDVAGAVGLAEAISLVIGEQETEAARMATLRDELETSLSERHPDLVVHGAEGPRAPHVSNLGVPGVDATALVQAMDLEGVAVSSGSACHSGATHASHVLTALYGPDANSASVRFSLGHLVGHDEVGTAAEIAGMVIDRLRQVAGSVEA